MSIIFRWYNIPATPAELPILTNSIRPLVFPVWSTGSSPHRFGRILSTTVYSPSFTVGPYGLALPTPARLYKIVLPS